MISQNRNNIKSHLHHRFSLGISNWW